MPRRTFFSFHYVPDVWRAWNVRNSWVVKPDLQVSEGFFDGSVFEASQKQGDENLKNFLRDGVKNTSVTCMLAGTNTWRRRWVRYEIARSILKGNGLLTVDIHGVKDKAGQTVLQGADPLAAMGVYKTDGNIYFAEWNGEKWIKYADYSLAIPASTLWFAAPATTDVMQFSRYCSRYDFIANQGRDNIGSWIEIAAKAAGL
jgi:MTH538 TIR-like domain (DUF1863)